MGGKESKMCKAFEAIDTSGDQKVTKEEIAAYLKTDRAKKLLWEFTQAEYEEFEDEVKNLGNASSFCTDKIIFVLDTTNLSRTKSFLS